MKATLVLFRGVAILALILHRGPDACGQEHAYALKGCVEVGGSASYSSITPVYDGQTGGTSSILSLAPLVGFFPAEGLEIGLSPGVSILTVPGGLTSINTSGSDETITLFQFFAFGGYNHRPRGSNVVPFAEALLGYSSESQGGASASGFSWGLRGGMKLAPVEHFLLAFSVQYMALAFTEEGESQRSGYNVLLIGISMGGFF